VWSKPVRQVPVRARRQLWSAVERRPALELLFPGASVEPDHRSPTAAGPIDRDAAAAELLRRHLEYRGPSTLPSLRTRRRWPESDEEGTDGAKQSAVI
jgi:hypothetical protein